MRALPPWLLEHLQTNCTTKKQLQDLLTLDLCKTVVAANLVAACVWTRYCDYLRYYGTSEHEGVLVSPLDHYLLSDPMKPFKPYDKISENMVTILCGWGPVDGGEGWLVVGCRWLDLCTQRTMLTRTLCISHSSVRPCSAAMGLGVQR